MPSAQLPPQRASIFADPPASSISVRRNLHTFLRLAEGVDADAWLHPLRQGDYSQWCRRDQRAGLAVGGRPLEAPARAGLPEIKRFFASGAVFGKETKKKERGICVAVVSLKSLLPAEC